jgi:UPF0755 protein
MAPKTEARGRRPFRPFRPIRPFRPFRPFRKVVFLFILLVAGWYWLQRRIDQPVQHGAAERIVTIAPGTNTQQIVRQLVKEGIVRSEWPAWIWLRTTGRSLRLKAGDYRFKSPISVRQAMEQMARGQVATRTLTIPEGYNRYDIARLLADLPGLRQAAMSPEKVLELFNRRELIADLDPVAVDLEGYLFPDTYEYTTSTTREQMVEQMVGRFRRVFTDQLRQKSDQLGLTLRQAVTMASLIEKEARLDREREVISAVFHRRLRERVPLACDPTVIYAALRLGKYRGKIYRSDLDRESPYNTYRNAGLPPGPIASPGRRSLEAALNPAPVDYLYFVVDATRNDGAHLFSTRAADHEAAVRRLRAAEQASRP